MDQVIKTIASQINYKELLLNGFKFVYSDNDLSLKLMKNKKQLVIKLDRGRDLYDIIYINQVKQKEGFFMPEIIKESKGIFCDQVSNIIEEWFNFKYINKPEFS